MKEILSCSIDRWVLAQFRTQIPQRERSHIIESLLRNFITDNEPTKSEIEIRNNIAQIQEKINSLNKELANSSVELARVEQIKKEEEKERQEQHQEIVKSGILQSLDL